MTEGERTFWGQVRATFVRGIAFIIPLGLTFWFFSALLNAVDGILSPVLREWLGRQVPGLGFLSMLIIILIVGAVSRNIVGKIVFSWFENFLSSVPLVRTVYGAIKDLVSAFAIGGKGKTFRQVVMVQYPRQGLYCIGFVTNETSFLSAAGERIDFLNVYFPHPPNPTSGVLIMVPRADAVPLQLTIEQGLKLVLSGGIVTPPVLEPALSKT